MWGRLQEMFADRYLEGPGHALDEGNAERLVTSLAVLPFEYICHHQKS